MPQDIRFGLTFGLGMGANAAVFSVMNAVVLKLLPGHVSGNFFSGLLVTMERGRSFTVDDEERHTQNAISLS